jgi:hypothetical protein
MREQRDFAAHGYEVLDPEITWETLATSFRRIRQGSQSCSSSMQYTLARVCSCSSPWAEAMPCTSCASPPADRDSPGRLWCGSPSDSGASGHQVGGSVVAAGGERPAAEQVAQGVDRPIGGRREIALPERCDRQ